MNRLQGIFIRTDKSYREAVTFNIIAFIFSLANKKTVSPPDTVIYSRYARVKKLPL